MNSLEDSVVDTSMSAGAVSEPAEMDGLTAVVVFSFLTEEEMEADFSNEVNHGPKIDFVNGPGTASSSGVTPSFLLMPSSIEVMRVNCRICF